MPEKTRTRFKFAAAPLGVISDTSLSAADLRILLAISNYDRFGGVGNGNGAGCYASQSRLAGDVGSSREQVNRSIKKLSAAGYVGMTRSGGRDQRRIYYVIFQPVTKRSHEGVTSPSQGVTGSSQQATAGCDELINREPVEIPESVRENNGLEHPVASPIYSAKQEYISRSEDISLSEGYSVEAAASPRRRYSSEAAPAPSRKRDAGRDAPPRRNLGGEAAQLERETEGGTINESHVRRAGQLVHALKGGESHATTQLVMRIELDIQRRYALLHGNDALTQLAEAIVRQSDEPSVVSA